MRPGQHADLRGEGPQIVGAPGGMVKLIFADETQALAGVHIIGHSASEARLIRSSDLPMARVRSCSSFLRRSSSGRFLMRLSSSLPASTFTRLSGKS